MEYGVIYIKICPPKGHPGEWIKYCHIFSVTPKSFQENVKQIANDINTKYADDIVIPMDIMVHPGCTTTIESVEKVATDMYNQFCELAERQGLDNYIRCVYSIGEIRDVNVDSTHHIELMHQGKYPIPEYDDVMIRIGHFLDESDEPGIFKI
jgi:hypothetical protein